MPGPLGGEGMSAEVHIISYFSLETDLAAELRDWPEFQSGSGYTVELASDAERVSVSCVDRDSEYPPYVRVVGTAKGPLFERVLGRVTYALAAHSDNLMIDRVK